jgi:exopolysaccharide biosynthesis polyprenyl glycosylphosphotransferase
MNSQFEKTNLADTGMVDQPVSERLVTGPVFINDLKDEDRVKHYRRAFVQHIYPAILLVFDALLIAGIFALLSAWRYDVEILQAVSRRVLLVIMVGSMAGVAMIGGYSYQTYANRFRFVSEHLIVSVGSFIGVFFVIYSFIAYGHSMSSGRSVVALTLVGFPAASITYRYWLSQLKSLYQHGNALCIIGAGWAAQDLYQRKKKRGTSFKMIVVSPDADRVDQHLIPDDPESPVVESMDTVCLNSSMHGCYVEHYVVACPLIDLPREFLKRLAVAQFNGNKICSYEAYLMERLKIIPPSELSMDWVMNDGFRLNKNPTYDRTKRMCDIVSSIIGMILLTPVFLVTALAVKLTSKGPVIFTQTRVGQKEKPFQLYKFRSMNVGSEKGAKYTAANDSRLTPIGKFLRKTRLDELPQFWNVLKGDLSVIGPRAEWIDLVKSYEKKFPYYHFRHAIKPGITGWAQVNYSYGQNDEDTIEKLNYDLYYIRKYTPLLDVIIVVKTFYMIIFGRGQ